MAIDPNIALQYGKNMTQLANPMEMMTQGMNMRRLAQQNQMTEEEFAKKTALKDAYSKSMITNPDGKTSLDENKFLGLYGEIDPTGALDVRKTWESRDLANKYKEFDNQFREKQFQQERFDKAEARKIDLAKIGADGKKEEKNIPQNVYAAATFGKRIEDSNRQMEDLIAGGYDPTSVTQAFKNKLLPEVAKDEKQKLMEQAQRNFANAVLRRESGAAIAPSEFESATKQYFPQVGDSEEVLNQKKRAREVVLAGLKTEGHKAWNKLESQLPDNKTASHNIKHGTVEDGYVFLGGDPSNQKNWIKK